MTDDFTGLADGTCGHPSRMITTDGLSGITSVVCSDCEREAFLRERRESFHRSALEHVATIAGLTVAELRARLGITAGAIRSPLPAGAKRERCAPTCVVCGELLAWRGRGRPPKYCVGHMPRKLRYNAKKRGDLRLQSTNVA